MVDDNMSNEEILAGIFNATPKKDRKVEKIWQKLIDLDLKLENGSKLSLLLVLVIVAEIIYQKEKKHRIKYIIEDREKFNSICNRIYELNPKIFSC